MRERRVRVCVSVYVRTCVRVYLCVRVYVGMCVRVRVCEHSVVGAGSAEWLWLERTLASVDRTVTPWLIVLSNHPM
jgi:hypothetical protein